MGAIVRRCWRRQQAPHVLVYEVVFLPAKYLLLVCQTVGISCQADRDQIHQGTKASLCKHTHTHICAKTQRHTIAPFRSILPCRWRPTLLCTPTEALLSAYAQCVTSHGSVAVYMTHGVGVSAAW